MTTAIGDSNVATVARIWIVPDAADLSRVMKTAGANVGDFLFEFDNSTLWVIHQSGMVAVSGSAAATTAIAGIVKKTPNIAALTDSTGGTNAGPLASIAAGAAYTQADMVAVKNAVATLNGTMMAIRTALVNAGVMTGP